MLRYVARVLNTTPAVVALSFARMADALGNSLLIIILPLYIAHQPSPWFPLPTAMMIGVVISLYGFLFAAGQPFAGIASDRLGRRKPFIVSGLALMTLATIGFIFAYRDFWVLVLRCVQGLGAALIVPSSMAIISLVTDQRTRGNAMGVYGTFRMIGFALGPLLGGFLHVHFGFNAAFIAGAALLATALVLVQVTIEDSRSEPRPKQHSARPSRERKLLRQLRPSPTGLSLMFSTVVMAASLAMIASLENELNERLSQTAVGFGIAFAALTVSRLVVQIPIARLSDHMGRKKLIVGGTLGMAPLSALFGFVTSTWQLIGVRVLQGVATAAIVAPALALAADLAPPGTEGREIAFVTTGFAFGLGIGPLLAGALAGYVSFRTPFYFVAALCVVAAALVWRHAEESIS